jgi:hypothetical protein
VPEASSIVGVELNKKANRIKLFMPGAKHEQQETYKVEGWVRQSTTTENELAAMNQLP